MSSPYTANPGGKTLAVWSNAPDLTSKTERQDPLQEKSRPPSLEKTNPVIGPSKLPGCTSPPTVSFKHQLVLVRWFLLSACLWPSRLIIEGEIGSGGGWTTAGI